MATIDQAVDQMAAAGMPPLPPGHPIADGKVKRYGPKKRAWYVLFEFVARNGRRYLSGSFGLWGAIESTKVETDWRDVDDDERARIEAAQRERAAAEQAKRERLARHAANRARAQWNEANAAPPAGGCPYLVAKGVQPPSKGIRYFRDSTLLVPAIRYDVSEDQERDPDYTGPRRMVGVQKIAPDGSKRFNKGMAKAGACVRLGKAPRDGSPLIIAEGLATALSIREALAGTANEAVPVFVAFDAGNLLPVAMILRALFPGSPVLFAADDDAFLRARLVAMLVEDFGCDIDQATALKVEQLPAMLPGRDGEVVTINAGWELNGTVPVLLATFTIGERTRSVVLENAGRTKAQKAAQHIGNATVCWPEFRVRDLDSPAAQPRATDFNDLHQAEGIDAVRAQIGRGLGRLPALAAASQGDPAENAAPASPAAGGRGGADRGGDFSVFDLLVTRFAQVYPSDEAFDRDIGRLVKVAHMKLMFGDKPVKWWLQSSEKRVVMVDDVVFDPTETCDPERTINLFRGIKARPAQLDDARSGCAKLLELIHYLCGENPEDTDAPVTTWVLRWAAYPLQHQGAKMQTAVVMYGDEGTGKNLFWGAIRDLYGQHGGVISQMQLQSQFNDWLSAKLFLIANEVVTRQEIRHHVGMLKNLITESEVWINPKNIAARKESNHCNLVFLSNELQPLQIAPGDRRHMVIRTPPPLAPAFYAEVAAEIRAGGAAALHQYLLELDLADFGVSTKPIATKWREDLIDVGLPSSQQFWRELHDDLLGIPYCPALVTDVYKAYTVWAGRNGHKMAEAINRFTPSFMSMNGVRRSVQRVRDPDTEDVTIKDADQVRQRKVFVMGDPHPDPKGEQLRVQQGVVAFRAALKRYLVEDRIYQHRPAWERDDEVSA